MALQLGKRVKGMDNLGDGGSGLVYSHFPLPLQGSLTFFLITLKNSIPLINLSTAFNIPYQHLTFNYLTITITY